MNKGDVKVKVLKGEKKKKKEKEKMPEVEKVPIATKKIQHVVTPTDICLDVL